MKLIDLTKVKQVQRGSVAADKKPELDLGILGIKIGQETPTGDTSRIEHANISIKKLSKKS